MLKPQGDIVLVIIMTFRGFSTVLLIFSVQGSAACPMQSLQKLFIVFLRVWKTKVKIRDSALLTPHSTLLDTSTKNWGATYWSSFRDQFWWGILLLLDYNLWYYVKASFPHGCPASIKLCFTHAAICMYRIQHFSSLLHGKWRDMV